MKFGPTRGNPLIIFEHFFKDFGLLLLAIAVAIFKGPDILLDNIFVLIAVIISPIAALYKYLFTKYSIDDEKMIIASGLLVKTNMEIPLKGITTVDLTQNLLFQFFGVYKIKADNSSQTGANANQAEIELVLKQEAAYYVKSLLEAKAELLNADSLDSQPIAQIEPAIKSTLSDFILLGALQSKLVYFITIVAAVFGGGGYIYKYISAELKLSEYVDKFMNALTPVVAITIIAVVAYLISLLASIVLTAIRYFDYTVTDREDALLVQYGLFTKKIYTLKKDKISGINIKQSILMRLLGYCSVEVFIIGYGDKSEGSEQEISLLFPVAKIKEVSHRLETLLPDMTFQFNYHKKVKGSLRYYFICFRMFLAIILLAGIIITSVVATSIPAVVIKSLLGVSIALLFLAVISVYLEYCNAGIHANPNVVAICKGYFSISMIFIKTKKLESLSESASIWKHKKGFTNIKFGFIAPLRVANMNVRNISYQDYEKLQKVIRY